MTDIPDLIAYYDRGGPCIDYNDECRYRPTGCPCTDTAQALRDLQAVAEALNEYQAVHGLVYADLEGNVDERGKVLREALAKLDKP